MVSFFTSYYSGSCRLAGAVAQFSQGGNALTVKPQQRAEATLGLPAGSLTEAAGIGHAARQRLEEILCGLLLTVPEVRARLRTVSLPLRNPQLRALAARALHGESLTGQLTAVAERLAQMVSSCPDRTTGAGLTAAIPRARRVGITSPGNAC